MLATKDPTRRKLLLAAGCVGYATHAPLDCCTSYGTQLYWPFSSYRVAWHNVAVVDPVFSLALLIGLVLAGLGLVLDIVGLRQTALRIGLGALLTMAVVGLVGAVAGGGPGARAALLPAAGDITGVLSTQAALLAALCWAVAWRRGPASR